MSQTVSTNFVAASLVAVEAAQCSFDPRVLRRSVPVFLYAFSADLTLPVGVERKEEFEKAHQLLGKRVGSYAPTMPCVKSAKNQSNPYAGVDKMDTVLTTEKYRHLIPVPFFVWEVLSKSKVPMTGAQVAMELARLKPEFSKFKWFNECVRDTLFDLSTVGLTERNEAKPNVSRTLYRAKTHAEIKAIAFTETSSAKRASAKKTVIESVAQSDETSNEEIAKSE